MQNCNRRDRRAFNKTVSLKATIISIFLLTLSPSVAISQGSKGDKPTSRNLETGSGPKADPKTFKDRGGPDFTVSAVTGSPILFTLTLSDKAGGSITSMYNRDQLALIKAIIAESQKFAQTDEAVGMVKAQITRFFNEAEPTFFVDVSKKAKTSQYFVTMKSRAGHITVDCGTIKRHAASQEPPFVEQILARISEATAPKQ